MVYGIGGELLTEYNGSTGALLKEYIYGATGLLATIEPTAINSNGTRYTTPDHLGSPRVITNSGASVVSRHDYKPFGEELGAGVGGRTTGMGFPGSSDGIRQKFTSKERDVETGLDYFLARYYSSLQGRFTSADLVFVDQHEADPQSWNLYSYVSNNPIVYTDPFGRWKKAACANDKGMACWQAEDGDEWVDLALDAGIVGLEFPAETASLLAAYFQNAPIVPGETTVDLSGFVAWKRSLNMGERVSIRLRTPVDVDFGGAGALRKVTKSASKSGVFSRLAKWLGLGKKAVKEIADELGYFPSKTVTDALKGQVSLESIPVAERELAAKFYERVANEAVSGPKEAAAKALNLARAKFLREGGNPPIDIHGFEP